MGVCCPRCVGDAMCRGDGSGRGGGLSLSLLWPLGDPAALPFVLLLAHSHGAGVEPLL